MSSDIEIGKVYQKQLLFYYNNDHFVHSEPPWASPPGSAPHMSAGYNKLISQQPLVLYQKS